MRLAVEHLLGIPDEPPEVHRQLHAHIPRAQHLLAQHAQILLQLRALE